MFIVLSELVSVFLGVYFAHYPQAQSSQKYMEYGLGVFLLFCPGLEMKS